MCSPARDVRASPRIQGGTKYYADAGSNPGADGYRCATEHRTNYYAESRAERYSNPRVLDLCVWSCAFFCHRRLLASSVFSVPPAWRGD